MYKLGVIQHKSKAHKQHKSKLNNACKLLIKLDLHFDQDQCKYNNYTSSYTCTLIRFNAGLEDHILLSV